MNKLLRVTKYVMRFINNLKKKVECENFILNNYVLSEEMKQSLFMWLKENQSLFLSESNFDNILRAHHVESTSIRRRYFVDTSKTKFRRFSTLFPRTFSM